MDRATAIEYSESMSQIGSGWWRQVGWAIKQGIPEALGMTDLEWKQRYYGHLKLAPAERPAVIKELKDQRLTNAQIGATIGVHPDTVNDLSKGRIRHDLRGGPAAAPEDEQHAQDERNEAAAAAKLKEAEKQAGYDRDFRRLLTLSSHLSHALYIGAWKPTGIVVTQARRMFPELFREDPTASIASIEDYLKKGATK